MTIGRHPSHGNVHDISRRRRSTALDTLFAPKSVAVIGATEKRGSVGRAVLENLSSFKGSVFPVNPKRAVVLGRAAFASIDALPEVPDLAVIVTPAASVPGVIRECVAKDIPSAIIISAGFKETGPAGADMEREILAEARRGGMRIIGPNCLGVMMPHAQLNATFAAGLARPGKVAFLSQSGALCTAILDWSFRENVGFSAFVSIGSMLDVGWGDLITYLGDDPRTKSIVCYMESVGDARSFLSAAREVALSKPIIVLKVGRTDAAAKAAASHTGSMTGSDEVLDAAFRRVGVLRVDSIAELFNMAEVLAKQPRPRGPRLAIITNAGGPGALSTDALIRSGGKLAELSPETRASLDAMLPPPWSHGNPVDILGDADAARYSKAVEIVSKDPNNDGLLVILTPQKMTDCAATAEQLKPFAKLEGKPLFASWMGGPEVQAGEMMLNEAGIPTFPFPDSAARAFERMWSYSENLRAIYETPSLEASSGAQAAPASAAAELERIRRSGRTILTETESKDLLAAYGIPTVETRIARSEDEAVALAEKLGFPVVLKLHSETITHKTDVGGVQLSIRTPGGVRNAWQVIQNACRERAGAQHFLGCTVQPMVSTDGYELILGSTIDPQFGPVLLFGAGGQLVEVIKDTVLGLPPLNATLARRLMERTKIFTALQGVRGRKAVDLAALEQLLVRFSQLVAELRWIAEIDINPLLASSDRLLALDARVVLHPTGTSEEHLPRPAIRPYPSRYITPWKLGDGTEVSIRPIRPEDEPLMVKFHQTLSDRSVYLRYFAPLKLDQRIAHERLSRMCFIDYDREMVLVVERRNPQTHQAEILGIGRLSKLHGANEAEFALTVSDQWQRQGLGAQLLKLLVQAGRDEKLERITATMLADNHEMQHVARQVGFKVEHVQGGNEYRAELAL
ncbi:MAG: bifunctional acetate--CoA ligase family protein/GNAT family N-acetyltransferase [Verrucomicrobia bacterium]|nr:bifunctional acetate--CoA ligase family protein/GNAT family N-acetyltransferase [Verrucomicrobiota bacterium]